MEVACIKLTAYSEADPSGYKEYPDFIKDIWGLVTLNRELFNEVYEITDESIVISWGKLSEITLDKLDYLRDRSYYSGHLNIVYKVYSQEIIKKLVRLWPYKNVIEYTKENITMDAKHKETMDTLVRNLSVDDALISFAHDADPMYVIASNTFISKLR